MQGEVGRKLHNKKGYPSFSGENNQLLKLELPTDSDTGTTMVKVEHWRQLKYHNSGPQEQKGENVDIMLPCYRQDKDINFVPEEFRISQGK